MKSKDLVKCTMLRINTGYNNEITFTLSCAAYRLKFNINKNGYKVHVLDKLNYNWIKVVL